MKQIFASIFLAVAGFLLNAEAAIKEPGWKHCIHPLHALPTQWDQIISPGFPNGINTQLQCSWVITANPGFRIKLAFDTLNVTGSRKSCFTQFVEIWDFKIGNSIGKFCGASRPGDYVSWGNRIRFDLQGDTSGAKTKGFDLRYKATKESGGFKSSWSFPQKTKSSKPKSSKQKPSKKKKKKKPAKPSKPRRPSSGRTRRPGTPPHSKGHSSPPKKSAPASKFLEVDHPTPSEPPKSQRPQKPSRPPQTRSTTPNRIEFRPPPVRRQGPVIYGDKANTRGVDHGHSSVLHVTEDEEPPIDMYVIIGIAVGGVVFLVLIIVLAKIFIFDKNKKRKNKQREHEEKKKKAQNAALGENIQMTMMHGMAPEQYTSEQIMPHLQSYHRMQSLPVMSPTMSHPYPMMHPPRQSMRRGKSSTAPHVISPVGPHSTQSLARSTMSRASRRDDVTRRSNSRASGRYSVSKSSLGRKRSRSLQYHPSTTDGWVRVDGNISKRIRQMAPESDTGSSYTTSSSDQDSESSRDYKKRSISRSRRARSMPRMKSHPSPYGRVIASPYYVTDNLREYDEGYDTGRRTTRTKSSSGNTKRHERRTAKGRLRRKYSY